MTGKTNAVSVGGGGTISITTSTVVGSVWGAQSGTSYLTIGRSGTTPASIYSADGTHVTFSDGVFTFLIDGTYKISYFGRGGYNSGGSSISEYYKFLPKSGWPSATNVANAGTSGSFTDTFTNGDTIYVQTRNSSGSNMHDFGFIIEYMDGGTTIPRALGESF